MREEYYMDDGTKVDRDSIPIPFLCLSCLKNQKNEVVCNITGMDQASEIKSGETFCCFAYEPNDPTINKQATFKEMGKYLANRKSSYRESDDIA